MNAQPARTIEERAARRHTLIWKGVLHHEGQSTPVRVRNVSTSGAMIESRTPLSVGSEPLLELSKTISVRARIEWAIGDHMGVSFHEPFDVNLLTQVRPVASEATWVPPRYLDSAVQAAWERRLRRLSPAELRAEFEGYIRD